MNTIYVVAIGELIRVVLSGLAVRKMHCAQ
jgi:hypothetical protein